MGWFWLRPQAYRLPMVAFCWLLTTGIASADDKFELSESSSDKRSFRVAVRMELDGQVQAAVGDSKAVAMKMTGNATLRFHERRLAGIGREATDFRSLRVYDQAEFHSQVAERSSNIRLRPDLQQIVAEGQQEGLRLYSPHGPLTYEELELIRPPVDSLTAVALLPAEKVEVGDEWETPRWAWQFLTAIEAVEKSELKCKLDSVKGGVAKVAFSGEITGGILGASSTIKGTGHYLYSLDQHCLTHLELNQTETRSVGAVTPGLKVTAKVTLDRIVDDHPALTDQALEMVPKEPPQGALLLMLDGGEWAIKLYHDRLWHLFHQSSTVAVLRFMERGSLVAQCNISPIGPAPAGKHIGEQQFQEDVQKAIGSEFQKIEKAEIVPTMDKRFVYRVIAGGASTQKTSKGMVNVPVNWIYYLVANPDGRQMVLVFTVEKSLVERFDNRDINLALGVDFQPKPSK